MMEKSKEIFLKAEFWKEEGKGVDFYEGGRCQREKFELVANSRDKETVKRNLLAPHRFQFKFIRKL